MIIRVNIPMHLQRNNNNNTSVELHLHLHNGIFKAMESSLTATRSDPSVLQKETQQTLGSELNHSHIS